MDLYLINKEEYNLSDLEVYSLKTASVFCEQNHNLYAVHEVYNAFFINILKRIEYFGTNEVLQTLGKSFLYHEQEENILKRWQGFSSYEIFKILKYFRILNKTTFHLFLSFYNYKKRLTLDDNINIQTLNSFFLLLKEELFLHKFVKYNKNKEPLKRRDEDKNIENRRNSDSKNSNEENEIKNENNNEIINTSRFNENKINSISLNEIYSRNDDLYEDEDENKKSLENLYI